MTVVLEAIKFNHDPSSETTDALNIRKNKTQFVTVPEWQRGISVNLEDSPLACQNTRRAQKTEAHQLSEKHQETITSKGQLSRNFRLETIAAKPRESDRAIHCFCACHPICLCGRMRYNVAHRLTENSVVYSSRSREACA